MIRVRKREYMLMIQRRGEVFLFHYTDRTRRAAKRMLGTFAGRPDLSFDWTDAARGSAEIERLRTAMGPKLSLPAGKKNVQGPMFNDQ